MAVKKAILIKDTNIEYLSGRFSPEEDVKPPLVVGYFLIAAFDSQDADFDLLTPKVFHENYQFTGRKWENEFLEVILKS